MGGFIKGILAALALVLLCFVLSAIIWPAQTPASMVPIIDPAETAPAAPLAAP